MILDPIKKRNEFNMNKVCVIIVNKHLHTISLL